MSAGAPQEGAAARWRARIHYMSAIATLGAGPGIIEVDHYLEELSELEPLVERGPDWNTILKIEITLELRTSVMTIEEAARL